MTETRALGLHPSQVRRLGTPRIPDFFIVGAPKSGTSAIAEYLAAHPDVYMAKKEMHLFGADLRFGARFYRRDSKAYLEEFNACNGHRRAGEASVWYLFSKNAAEEIRAFNPDSSIVILLREPIQMLYSLYYQFRCDGNEQIATFPEALAAEDDRRTGRRIARQAYFLQGLLYRETIAYTDQVRRYFSAFGRERVHVIIYDDLATDPAAVYRGLLDFLRVDSSLVRTDFKVVNASKRVRSKALQAVLSEPLLRRAALTIGLRLPRAVLRTLALAETRLWQLNTRSEQRAPLPPELCTQLKREFAPEVERLSELLGRDLTFWGR